MFLFKVSSLSFFVQGFLFELPCGRFSLSVSLCKVFSLKVSSLIFVVLGFLFQNTCARFSLYRFPLWFSLCKVSCLKMNEVFFLSLDFLPSVGWSTCSCFIKAIFPPLPLLFIQSLCTVGPVGQNQSSIGQLKQEKSCVGRLGGTISGSQFYFVSFFNF